MKKLLPILIILILAFDSKSQTAIYRGNVEIGYQIGTGSGMKIDQLMVSTTHGAVFGNGRWFAGAGIGFGCSTNYTPRLYTFPVYGAFRYMVTSVRLRPYIEMKLGYSVCGISGSIYGSGSYKGGVCTSPSVGITVPLNSALALDFGVGYAYQRVSYESPFTGSGYPIVKSHFNGGGWFLKAALAF